MSIRLTSAFWRAAPCSHMELLLCNKEDAETTMAPGPL